MKLPSFRIVYLFLALICCFSGCSTLKNKNIPDVPISISIRTDNSYVLSGISFDWYKFKLLEELQRFQRVNLDLVEPDEKPLVELSISIEDANIWPKEDNRTNRNYSSRIQTGTDSKGNPIFQVISASVEIIQTRIRSNARFNASIAYRDSTRDSYRKSFYPSYVWQNVSIGNISGDSRAVDPSIYTAGRGMIEPLAQDLLLELAKRDMLRLLSDDIQRHFQKAKK